MAAQVDLSGFAELRAILRIRPFRRLWLATGLSSLGDWLGLLVVAMFAADQVSSSTARGLAFGSVIAVRLLPALILGPIAGILADRFDRRYTMVICDILRFALFASIPAVGTVVGGGPASVGWAAVATFLIETIALIWAPAKDAAVPNLVPKARLEKANQLTLITTYGLTPVPAALIAAGLTRGLGNVSWLPPATDLALYFNALTFLTVAIVVLVGIKEISRGHRERAAIRRQTGMLGQFVEGWRYVSHTPLVRGLVLGILGAFASAGVVVGTAQFYAQSLGAGQAAFYLLFAAMFTGVGVGVGFGPRLVGDLSRRRWFGLSIIFAAGSVAYLAIAPHLALAIFGCVLVGMGAGMAFLAGITLLGGEVTDNMRGRVFAVVQVATRGVLVFTMSVAGVLVGLGASRRINLGLFSFQLSTSRVLLAVAGVIGVVAGVAAFRHMDDKPGVGILPDLWSSIWGRPLGRPEVTARKGLFVVFEGGEGAGKSTQAVKLAAWLRLQGHTVVVTREPGATDIGSRIRALLLNRELTQETLSPRAEALLYAADRAHHVATVVRPALARGEMVISDRYIDSSLAYQGAGRTLPVEEVAWLSNWATGSLKPDLVVLLDIDPMVGLTRVERRGDADRVERESLQFHDRVRYQFLDLAAADPKRYLVLDATQDVETIAEQVRQRVSQLIRERELADDDFRQDTSGDAATGMPSASSAKPSSTTKTTKTSSTKPSQSTSSSDDAHEELTT